MSKTFSIVLIFVLQFTLFTSTTLALDRCDSSGINYYPNWIPENSSNIDLRFTIGNQNTFTTLLNKQVKLHFDNGIGPWDDWETDPITVQNYQFSIMVADENFLKKGSYEAKLRWQPDPNRDNFEDFCSNITYRVGASGRCIIDASLPSKIPPGSKLTIKFIGQANTNYQLRFGAGGKVADVTTDDQGQGQFTDIPIPGVPGETVKITIISFSPGGESCHKDIKIDANAPPPPTPGPGPITPAPSAKQCKQGDPDCTSGGGKLVEGCSDSSKPGYDPNNPGIATAIGCIHTNPAEFVKDLMKFVIGISGGLAFLMMLLGAFQMLTSAGNPETLSAGRDRLTSAVIGLLFVIFAILLLQIIGVDILQIPGFGR